MQRTLTFSIALLLGAFLCKVFAQELKVKSFVQDAEDLIARTSPREDLNGKPCAVIRVGIALQNVQFAGNVMGDPIAEPGEYLVYMPQGNRELTIRHNNYLPLIVNFADYGIGRLQSGCTYRLTILSRSNDSSGSQAQGNFLVMNVTPANAVVTINNQQVLLNESGELKQYLPNGVHSYTVKAGAGYEPFSGSITMSGERISLPITLQRIVSSLTITTATSGTSIYINEEYKGIDRWHGSLAPGTYLVEARKVGYGSVTREVTLSNKQSQEISMPALQLSYGSLMVNYDPIDASVYLDGKYLGKTPNVFGELPTGSHEIKVVKEGYAAHTEKVTISENQQASVNGKLERTGGSVSLSSNSSGAPVSINGHDYVDLGLSVKWATQNVGASSPSDYGDYFAWGETRPKSYYDWSNCFDCRNKKGTKWGTYKIGGQTRIIPTSGHDTARENWGGSWRLPTDAEFDELCQKCTWTWITQGGHKGYKVTGPNGNSIFLPAAGWRYGADTDGVGESGIYWSSTLSSSGSGYAHYLYFNSSYHGTYDFYGRRRGQSVRPVTD